LEWRAVQVTNLVYYTWWVQDQRILVVLLTSMSEEVVTRMTCHATVEAGWTVVHDMFRA
jgi:hypothetical protein